jgi:hypothetical protein
MAERLQAVHHSSLGRWANVGVVPCARGRERRRGSIVAIEIIVHDITDGLNTVLLVSRGELVEKKDIAFLAPTRSRLSSGSTGSLFGPLVTPARGLSGSDFRFFLFTATGDLLPDARQRSLVTSE